MIQSKYSHPLHQLKALVTRLKVTKRIFDPLLQGTALAVDILLQKMMKILLNKNQVALACKEMTSIQLQGTALELVMLIRTKILKN
ncbi:hypothetical protein Goklo_027650 [Gossypium klotzschianum]|uniref:Uncharacterized protein n=1 Tax=Gossypium klotzschianum TaxID=34286 RepID=A0A7J8TYV1_9ROSI|nr:hypothetical protein [Gossypium klotzschianum]